MTDQSKSSTAARQTARQPAGRRGIGRGCPCRGVLTGLAVLGVAGLTSGARADGPAIELEQQRLAVYATPAAGDKREQAASSHDLKTRESAAGQAADGPFDSSRQYFFVPPERSGFGLGPDSEAAVSAALTSAETLGSSDVGRATALFDLAQRALDAGQGQLAFRLAHEVLQFDPAHQEARRWVGLPQPPARRLDPARIRAASRPHPRFGWRAGSYRRLVTPHFQITTNDDPTTGLELARTLEELHVVWEQLFFDCWSDTVELQARSRGVRRQRRGALHQVVMFRTRDEYVQFIRTLEPQAELTRGYYHAPSRTAYFIGGERPQESTWRHEVTHQLFHEYLRPAQQIGADNNFWIVEGVALYMESHQRCRQWMTVGGLEAERLQYARFRALREGFYRPLEALVDLDQHSLQRDDRIRQLYSQAAGVTHFLLDGQRGRYRPALMQYLKQVYQGTDQRDSLTQLTGASWEELDRQYGEFLQVDDQQLEQLDPDAQLRQLCLGATTVTDRGFAGLPSLQHLRWLDVFGLQISDQGTRSLGEARQLEQLSLERTQISDVTVARLRTAKGLQQLDLSGTRITDAALATVAELTELEALWLTGTQVTDDGLRQLIPLKQLRILDLGETQTTAEGRATLRRALPRWQAD